MTDKHINSSGLQVYPGGNAKVGFTAEGGLKVRLVNKTGAASVKGTLVRSDTNTSGGFIVAPGDSDECIGVVYESGVADGSECWIVVSGIAEVLLKNSTGSLAGGWAYMSDVAGRMITASDPPGGTIGALDNHMKEIGHSIQYHAGGTDVLVKIIMHFN
jgi:hypothetical protein